MIPVLLGTACDKTVCPVSNDAEQVVFTCSLSQMKSSFREDFSQQWHPDDLVGIYGTVGGNGLGKNLPYLVNVCDEDPSKADFSNMATATNNLYIGRVLHKTNLQVSEMGTKAGAATVVEMKALQWNHQSRSVSRSVWIAHLSIC